MTDENASMGAATRRVDRDVASVSVKVTEDRTNDLALQRSVPSDVRLQFATTEARVGAAKRLFDIFGACAIGLLMLPVMVVISVAIRASGSPVIFSHTRVGIGRRSFRCFKFRTMVPDADQRLRDLLSSDRQALQEWRKNHKLIMDPRVTRFGGFLRRSSLDELPQLWNVLRGDMSLVGPRPVVLDELERYGNKAKAYCSVRPGMTGLWQISGRSNVTFSRRVSLDVLYIRKQTVLVDCWVLWQTLYVVFRRIGAY